MSSAHVYLRMPQGVTAETIPEAVLEDCAQLVKANSIQGSKMAAVTVVYTPFENLKKTGGMDVGQVGFHDMKKVYKVREGTAKDAATGTEATRERRSKETEGRGGAEDLSVHHDH